MNPFNLNYVMRKTTESMRKCIEFSIRKTLERNNEFEGEPEKQREIVETLQCLHSLYRLLAEYEENNPKIFNQDYK